MTALAGHAGCDLEGADADAVVAMATDQTGEALELRAWAARNRHDLPSGDFGRSEDQGLLMVSALEQFKKAGGK